jgi:hypothetical protein
VVDFVRLEVWVFDRYPETRAPFMQGYHELRSPAEDEASRLDLYRGMEYLAELCRNGERGEWQVAGEFRARLERWLKTIEMAP